MLHWQIADIMKDIFHNSRATESSHCDPPIYTNQIYSNTQLLLMSS